MSSREQQSLADQGSQVAASLLREAKCTHEARCACYSRYRVTSWLALDALVNAGWQLVPPAASVGERDA